MREEKTLGELENLVREEVQRSGRQLDGSQWIRVEPIEPAEPGGPNWKIGHHGDPGGHSDALDEAERTLQAQYVLKPS
jgi:hypothetical protein